MIDGKEAVKTAMEYLKELYNMDQCKDVMLEELNLNEDDNFWEVTIGFSYAHSPSDEGPMSQLVGSKIQYKRTFKVFTIDSKNGAVRSIKSKQID